MSTPKLLSIACLATLTACSDDAPVVTDAGPDVVRRADAGTIALYLSPSSGFEGQRRFVAQLSPAFEGDDLTNATVTAEDSAAGFVLDELRCNRDRCAIAAHLDDVTPNRGAPVPSVMDGRRVRIITRGRLFTYASNLTVFPLDTANAMSMAAGSLPERAIYSSFEVPAGVTLRATASQQPIRVVVMGTLNVHGRIELTPNPDGTPSAGGTPGGAPGAAGGDSGGGGHPSAGGGGGHLRAGAAGMSSDGAVAGAPGPLRDDVWLTGLLGGAGGGGGGGRGGAGGGVLQLVGFGTNDFAGAVFDGRGGDGVNGGGGGAGGAVMIAGALSRGMFQVDLRGGAGGMGAGGAGGAGSPGRSRLDGLAGLATVMGADRVAGPAFDVANIPAIVRTPTVMLRGTGAPGSMVQVRDELSDRHPMVRAMVGPDGNWTANLTLPAEGNPARLVVGEVRQDGSIAASFSGSTLLTHVEDRTLVFDSGALDLVYLPMR